MPLTLPFPMEKVLKPAMHGGIWMGSMLGPVLGRNVLDFCHGS